MIFISWHIKTKNNKMTTTKEYKSSINTSLYTIKSRIYICIVKHRTSHQQKKTHKKFTMFGSIFRITKYIFLSEFSWIFLHLLLRYIPASLFSQCIPFLFPFTFSYTVLSIYLYTDPIHTKKKYKKLHSKHDNHDTQRMNSNKYGWLG